MGMEEAFPGWNAKRAEEEAARVADAEARRAANMACLKRKGKVLFYIFVLAPLIVMAIFTAIVILGVTLAYIF